jgi:N-acetylglucosaminyl-diphospho-decaprenol L-rhamnosyltransferase
VVNYESGPALARCVRGLAHQDPAELVVVDNGSSDGSVDELRRRVAGVAVLDPGANLGYGAAANRGVAATCAPAVLVCNSDLEVGRDGLAILAGALEERPGCGVVGPLIRDASGRRYPSARRFPSLVDAAGHAMLGLFAPDNRFTRAYHQAELAGTATAREVDWLSGACLLLRRRAFEEVGGFDESYFMYAEDVDLCWRLARAGWSALYVPEAEVTHLQGVSTGAHPYRMILEHHRSLLRFAARSSTGWRKVLLPLVAVGLAVRAALAFLVRLSHR